MDKTFDAYKYPNVLKSRYTELYKYEPEFLNYRSISYSKSCNGNNIMVSGLLLSRTLLLMFSSAACITIPR